MANTIVIYLLLQKQFLHLVDFCFNYGLCVLAKLSSAYDNNSLYSLYFLCITIYHSKLRNMFHRDRSTLVKQLTTGLISVSIINTVYLLVDTGFLQGNFILLVCFLKFFNL